MKALRKSILIGAALVALPLPAAAQELCAALNRISAAAREPEPFASLAGDRQVLPDYEGCRVDTGADARISCHSRLAPPSLLAEQMGAKIQDCLGATMVPQAIPSGSRQYRTATLSIYVQSNCDERCRAGRIASISITRRRPD